MTTRRKPEAIDPTLPFTEIDIAGKTYKMCFDLGALAKAEDELVGLGNNASLLMAMVGLTFSRIRTLFAVSLHVYHPELDFETCKSWVTRDNISEVALAIHSAWNANAPDPDPVKNPPQPAP